MVMNDSLKRLSRTFGVSVRLGSNARPLDLTNESGINPIEASYIANGRPFFLNIPLRHIVHLGYLAFKLDIDSASPYVHTLTEYMQGKCNSYHGSPLECYYNTFQPRNIAELMGIERPSRMEFSLISALYAPHLWSTCELKHIYDKRRRITERENRIAGDSRGIDEGASGFGPVSESKGQIEFKRLTATLESIRQRGFKPDKKGVDNLDGVCLYCSASGGWVIAINGGNHRAACLSVLKHENAVVQISPLGRGGVFVREEASSWPIVQKNFICAEEARAIFDRTLMGTQPFSAKMWLEVVHR